MQGIGDLLQTNNKETLMTFNKVNEKLVRIDEAQKNIDRLGDNISSLQSVLTDKKTRGIFGEVQLQNILEAAFGAKKGDLFDLQKKLSNGKIVDAMVYLPKPLGHVAIDSKFPLENFQRMMDVNRNDHDYDLYRKEFVKNVKKHIDDISSKYQIAGETAEHAVLFIPAEAIFAEIHAYHEEIITYAYKKKVWPTSPSTLMAMLTVMQALIAGQEQAKHITVIQSELTKLQTDFGRYQKRWSALEKHGRGFIQDLDDVAISSRKIEQRLQKIIDLEIES